MNRPMIPGPGGTPNPGPPFSLPGQNNGGRKNGGGGRKKNKQGIASRALRNRRVGAYGGYEGVRYGDALALANGEIRAGINDLRKDRRQVRRETRNGVKQAKLDYQRGKQDLKYIYGESQDYIGALNQQNQALYDQQNTRLEAAKSMLLDQMNANAQQGVGAVNADLAQLGIAQGADYANLAASDAQAQNMAALMGSQDSAMIQAQKAAAATMGNLSLSQSQGQMQANMGQILNNRNDSIRELRQNQIDANNQVREAMSDLRGTRGDLVRQLLDAMAERGWGQYVQEEQLKLQRKASRGYRGNGGGGGGGDSQGGSEGSTGSSRYSGSTSGSRSGDGNKKGGRKYGDADLFNSIALSNLLGGRK